MRCSRILAYNPEKAPSPVLQPLRISALAALLPELRLRHLVRAVPCVQAVEVAHPVLVEDGSMPSFRCFW